MLNKKTAEKNGFTILEIIITVFVISVAFTAVMSLITRTITDAQLNSSRLIAAYLAQEGIEIVRNIRDSNWLQAKDWNDGLGANSYQADYNDLMNLSVYSDSFLKINNNGFYSYDQEGESAKFKRIITISSYPDKPECPPDDCLEVEVKVLWKGPGGEQSVVVKERFYNWINKI